MTRPLVAAGRCGYCGKQSFETRKKAKKAMDTLYPGRAGYAMNTYRCADGGQWWHIGHRNATAVHRCRRGL